MSRKLSYGLYTVVVIVFGMLCTTKLSSLLNHTKLGTSGLHMFLKMCLHAFGLMAGWAFDEELRLLLPGDENVAVQMSCAVFNTLGACLVFHWIQREVLFPDVSGCGSQTTVLVALKKRDMAPTTTSTTTTIAMTTASHDCKLEIET
eukprot:TRINITY_DN31599_c0_g1_i1.p1 TRINITY_DN31599_c0_g1~~TRINITY_DN31599_c0_g1_i1.p1  ORF type:complete len:147 (+),score=44.09 TRINITY_DN31599_c0_g1_i1:117-557(+)